MRGVGGSGEVYDGFYYEFASYVFEKNQNSPFPLKREQFFTVFQEIWAEMKREINEIGPKEFYFKMANPENLNKLKK